MQLYRGQRCGTTPIWAVRRQRVNKELHLRNLHIKHLKSIRYVSIFFIIIRELPRNPQPVPHYVAHDAHLASCTLNSVFPHNMVSKLPHTPYSLIICIQKSQKTPTNAFCSYSCFDNILNKYNLFYIHPATTPCLQIRIKL